MIKTIQKKLLNAGYITNGLNDKRHRFEIHEFLKEQQNNHLSSHLITAVDLFLKKYAENSRLNIKNKSAYFIKSVLNTINELDVPNIAFENKEATKEEILDVIFRILYSATTPLNIDDLSDVVNPISDSDWRSFNQFINVDDATYFKAINFMIKNKKHYDSIIERLIQFNIIDDPDFNFTAELFSINTEIDLIGESYV